MKSVQGGIMVPHPPIILPNIGKGEEKKIADIDAAYKQAAKAIRDMDPDTIVIVSPHAPSYYDYIQVSSGPKGQGDMGRFRDRADSFSIRYDQKLIREIDRLCQAQDLPAGTLGRQDGDLDHGTMIPLYYLKDLILDKQFIRIGIGGPDHLMHYRLGKILKEAAENTGRRIAVVASGDLSHCQKEDSSYGFKACGPEYDRQIMEIMGQADFESLLEMDEAFCEDAMVCGHKPFCVLAGALDQTLPQAEDLGHSAVFGVGYGVVTFTDPVPDPERDFLKIASDKKKEAWQKRVAAQDPYARLAVETINSWVQDQRLPQIETPLPKEMQEEQAGVFVSIHKNGQLRGCIGTIAPTQENIQQEIMQNAVSASTRDPRFPAIQPWELEDLEVNVDVLGQPETIDSADQLDVKKYGVIVSKRGKRGLLLPNLEGVDTVEQQLRIAKQKAGLAADEPDVSLQRFEVVRHV